MLHPTDIEIAARAEAEWERCGICRQPYTACWCCPGQCGRQTEDGDWCRECARAERGWRQSEWEKEL